MKLKYYLRGVGIGIVGTTIIFMILISLNRIDTKTQEDPDKDAKPQTVAELEENIKETESESSSEAKKPAETEKDALSKKEPETEKDKLPAKEPETEKGIKQEEKTPKTEPDTGKQQQEEKVRFEIRGGEYSDTICKKLKDAGLIDNAEAFNAYLVEKNFDNAILPGTYDIPKDSTYEEIAVLLTAKVEVTR